VPARPGANFSVTARFSDTIGAALLCEDGAGAEANKSRIDETGGRPCQTSHLPRHRDAAAGFSFGSAY
jgi:hypothetical protein